MNGISFLSAFALYGILLATIAIISHRAMRTATDFIVGNRSLNFWLTALSAHASDMSAWLFMAFPAGIYLEGGSRIWAAFGLILGMFLNWHLLAQKLRIATEKYQANTLSAYLESRFQDNSGLLRILTATMLVLFMSCYLCAGLIAVGFVLESVVGLNYYWGLTAAALFAMAYTFSGGFITVAWTDLFQALFLLLMIILVPITAVNSLSHGLESVISAASQLETPLNPFHDLSSPLAFFNLIALALGWGLGYFGQPHIITKFMGISHPQELRKAKYLGMTWQITALSAATCCGMIGIAFFPNGLANPELLFVEMVKELYTPFWSGIILCAILAANMSTMDSQILVCASTLSEDLWVRFVQPGASAQQRLQATRTCIVLIALLALAVAFQRSATVLETVLYAWTGLGCAFGPIVLLSLYFPSINRYGALAGIFVGGAVAVLWNLFYPSDALLAIPAMLPGFFLSSLSIFACSHLANRLETAAFSTAPRLSDER